MQTITIAEVQFSYAPRYGAGHELTEHEAEALNRVLAENVGNNLRKQVKEKGLDQAAFDKAFAEYAFGARRAAGPRTPTDPVEAEAYKLAKAAVLAKIKSDGKTVKAEGGDFTPAAVSEAAHRALASEKYGPIFRKRAQAVVRARGEALEVDLAEATA